MTKTNWFETPKTKTMTNSQVEQVVKSQSNYFDIFPNAWNTDWNDPLENTVVIYEDTGLIYFKGQRISANKWKVKTTF